MMSFGAVVGAPITASRGARASMKMRAGTQRMMRHRPGVFVARASERAIGTVRERGCAVVVRAAAREGEGARGGASRASSGARASGSGARAGDESVAQRLAKAIGTAALALALAFTCALSAPEAALAARSGGRMGGGSFRASSSSFRSASSGSSFRSLNAPSVSAGAVPTRTSSFFIGPGFGYGFGMGPGLYYGGGGFFNILMLAMFFVFVSNMLQNLQNGAGFGDGLVAGGDSISVVKIQVGLLGTARSLQRDLERIADRADTSTPEGLHYVLEETVLALLRNPEYCVYGYATSKVCRGPEQAEEVFNDLSIDERGKFEKETLVNVNSRKNSATAGVKSGEDTNDYILVTIIAACDGGVKMPEITDASDMKTALKRLGAVRVEALQAVEVLWTPQEDGDVLTQIELLRDYPILVNL